MSRSPQFASWIQSDDPADVNNPMRHTPLGPGDEYIGMRQQGWNCFTCGTPVEFDSDGNGRVLVFERKTGRIHQHQDGSLQRLDDFKRRLQADAERERKEAQEDQA